MSLSLAWLISAWGTVKSKCPSSGSVIAQETGSSSVFMPML